VTHQLVTSNVHTVVVQILPLHGRSQTQAKQDNLLQLHTAFLPVKSNLSQWSLMLWHPILWPSHRRNCARVITW